MMQYGVHPFKDEGCTTCVHYKHASSDCMVDYKRYGRTYPKKPGLSPCKAWEKGFVLVENSWGMFKPVTQDLPKDGQNPHDTEGE